MRMSQWQVLDSPLKSNSLRLMLLQCRSFAEPEFIMSTWDRLMRVWMLHSRVIPSSSFFTQTTDIYSIINNVSHWRVVPHILLLRSPLFSFRRDHLQFIFTSVNEIHNMTHNERGLSRTQSIRMDAFSVETLTSYHWERFIKLKHNRFVAIELKHCKRNALHAACIGIVWLLSCLHGVKNHRQQSFVQYIGQLSATTGYESMFVVTEHRLRSRKWLSTPTGWCRGKCMSLFRRRIWLWNCKNSTASPHRWSYHFALVVNRTMWWRRIGIFPFS